MKKSLFTELRFASSDLCTLSTQGQIASDDFFDEKQLFPLPRRMYLLGAESGLSDE